MGKVTFDSVCVAICELSLDLCRSLHNSSPCISALGPRRAVIFNGSTRITLHFSDPQCFISPLFCHLKLIFPTYFFLIICSFIHILQPQPCAGGPQGAGGLRGSQEAGSPHLVRLKKIFRFPPLRHEAVGIGPEPASCISGNGLCDCCVEPCARMRWEF